MPEVKELLIQNNQCVAELNRVPGFDPVKLLQKVLPDGSTGEGGQAQLVLKYKKLWFRLACPHGRIWVTALRLTEQMAIVQAEIYRDKDDAKPVSNFVASRTVHNTPGGLYIQAAEYEAVDNALTDAGFGIQLCNVCKTWGEEAYVPTAKADPEEETELTAAAPVSDTDQEREVGRAVETDPPSEPMEEVEPKEPVPQADTDAGAGQEPHAAGPAAVAEATDADLADGTLSLEAGKDLVPEEMQGLKQREPMCGDIVETTGKVQELEQPASDIRPDDTVQAPVDQPQRTDPVEAAAEPPLLADADSPAPETDGTGEMTLEEARNMIADVGSCRGKTLAQIADRRPTTLRWYFTTCPDSSEQLKKAARLVFESLNLPRSA